MGFFDGLKKLLPSKEDLRAQGISLPLDSEINSLNAKLKALKNFQFQASNIKRLHIPRIKARKTVNAEVYAANLSKALSQADAQATATVRLINAALADGRRAQEQMKFGSVLKMGKPTAAFMLKKKIADDAYMKAKTRFDQAIASWQNLERLLASEPVPMVKQYAQAVYSTAREAAGRAGRGLVTAGQAAEKAAEGAGALAPYAKFAAPVAVGLLALWAYGQLPRAQKVS